MASGSDRAHISMTWRNRLNDPVAGRGTIFQRCETQWGIRDDLLG
jgi:hypothetical protein